MLCIFFYNAGCVNCPHIFDGNKVVWYEMHYRFQWALLKICTLTKHELSNLSYRIVLVLLRGWADQRDLRLLWRIFAESCTGENIFQNTLIKKQLGVNYSKYKTSTRFDVQRRKSKWKKTGSFDLELYIRIHQTWKEKWFVWFWNMEIDSITIIALSLPVTNYIFPMKCCYSSNYEWKQ